VRAPGQRVDLRDRKRASKRLAIGERLPAVAGALLAVSRCSLAIAGGLHAMLSGLHAEFPGALALLGGAHHDLRARARARVVVLVVGVTLDHRQIARGGSPIARQRRQIAGLSGRVTLVGALKARRGGLLALTRRAPCAVRRAPTDITARVVLSGVDAMRGVAIAGGLIAIGRGLVAVGTCLVSLTARLITVCQRLIALAERLICTGKRRSASRTARQEATASGATETLTQREIRRFAAPSSASAREVERSGSTSALEVLARGQARIERRDWEKVALPSAASSPPRSRIGSAISTTGSAPAGSTDEE
jgi:hypothetical protein